MRYPIVYDKFDTAYTGYGVAILQNASEVQVDEKLNGSYSLELVLPRNDEKWEYIEPDAFIRIGNQLFIIRTFDEIRDSSGRLVSNIQCEHVFFELLDGYIVHQELLGVSAQAAADAFVAGTRFKVDATRVSGLRDIEVEDCTPITALNELLRLWKCEYVCAGMPGPDSKFLITLYPQRGSNNNVQFRYRKNLKSIRKRTDARGVTTRLFVYGKDGLGIEGAAANIAGTPYIDSGRISQYPRPKIGSIRFGDISDPDELYAAGMEYLAGVEVPQVSYETDVVELSALAGYGDAEAYGVGDTIRVIDEDLNTDVSVRVVRRQHYPFEPHRAPKVEIANSQRGIEDVLADLNGTKQTVDRVTHKGKVNTFWLDGIIDVLKNRFDSASSNWYTDSSGNLIFEALDGGSAMKLAGTGFALADSKTAGEWDWRTFGTGQGFTADEVNAGILYTSLVKIMSGTGDTVIDGDNLTMTRQDKKSRTVIDHTAGFKLQRNIGSAGSPSWQDTIYTDVVTGALTALDLVTDRLIMRTGGSTLIDAATRTIDFSGFTTKIGKIPSLNIEDLTAAQINAVNGIVLGSNATINWSQMNSDPATVAAQNSANSAIAIGAAIANGTYSGGTFINGQMIYSPNIFGGNIAIGSGNNIFKADANGIYLGNSSFVAAPFRVDMNGNVYAANGNFSGTLRTSPSGTRVEMSSNYADINLYNGSMNILTIRDQVNGNVTMFNPSGNSLYIGNSLTGTIRALGSWDFSSANHNLVAKFG